MAHPAPSPSHEAFRPASNRAVTARSLDDLARMDPRALGLLYEGATMPDGLARLDGDCRGRMLAVRGTRGVALSALARFAAGTSFPWEGKSFHAESDRTGTGINRVHLGGRHRLFPFQTRFGASVLDGRPAVILDYDLADNPGPIRAIHDEVRQVARGLFFGPACWKRARGGVELVLWFGLDARGPGHDAAS